MIRASFTNDGAGIKVTTDAESATVASKLPGARRTKKMPPLIWRMPLTLDSITALRDVEALAAPNLRAEARRMREVQAFVDGQKGDIGITPLAPPPLKAGCTLYRHQIKAFNIALALMGRMSGFETLHGGGCALYLEMGLGKSLSAIAITGRLFLDGHIRRVLVVAPTSVCPVWPAEYAKFAGFPHRVRMLLGTRAKRLNALKQLMRPTHTSGPLQVAVINYESTWRLEDELSKFAPDMIICDESQRIKSHTAAQSKAMHRLGDAARYKLTLTGTPMQQDVRDIWSQYRFLAPDIFGRNFYTFQNRYCVFGGYGNHQYFGPRHLDELTGKMHSVALRIRKEDCLDLPEKTFEGPSRPARGRRHHAVRPHPEGELRGTRQR